MPKVNSTKPPTSIVRFLAVVVSFGDSDIIPSLLSTSKKLFEDRCICQIALWELVAEIQASSLADFDNVLREVRLIDGIANSETSILLSTI